MSSKLKRLILYEAPRHKECHKASVKQCFIPSKMNSSISRGAPHTRKYFGKIYNHHQITKLSSTLGNFQNNQKLISFASALTNLKNLCLTINVACLDQYNKVVKKLFLRKKRITEIKLILKGTQAKTTFPWKALEMLKCLGSLKIMMQFSGLSMLQSYSSLLKNKAKRNIFPSLKSQHILVNLAHPHIERPSLKLILEVLTNIEVEAKKYSPYKFSFDFHTLSLDQSELRGLCSIYTDVQSLSTLTLDGRFLLETEEKVFKESLVKTQKLEELSWLISPKETAHVLGFLPEILVKLEVCKKLRLWIRSEPIDSCVDWFLIDLRGISHLRCLSLSFTRSKGILSSSLIALADSLEKMPNLQDLTILCEKKSANLIFDSESIEHLFESLRKCTGLESLCLNFFDHFGKMKRQAFLNLCTSLQNLNNLRTVCLELSFDSINIDEEVIELWNKTLINLSNLVDFSFNLIDFGSPFEANTFSRFIESFGSLKLISALKLVLRFRKIEPEVFLVLEKLVYNLKSLDSFVLQFLTRSFKGVADDDADALKKIEEKFSYKAFLQFEIEHGL